jgi:hypothetical protein
VSINSEEVQPFRHTRPSGFAAAPGPLLAAKTAVGSAAAPGQTGYIDMVDGERRLPNAIGVAQASGASTAQAAGAALPVSAQAAAGTPIVTGNAGDDTIDAVTAATSCSAGAGADNFVFGPNIQLNAATPAQITHVADYSAARGDTFDFSAITSGFHNSVVSDALVVRVVEDASGKFATLQAITSIQWASLRPELGQCSATRRCAFGRCRECFDRQPLIRASRQDSCRLIGVTDELTSMDIAAKCKMRKL